MVSRTHLPAQRSEANLEDWKALIEGRLEQLTPRAFVGSESLRMAWRHSALAPAKRLRGLLLICVLRDLGCPVHSALDYACALELVHTASLIFDDLPCMDDARLRRGRPTLHRAVGESSAILSAVAMLNEAFGLCASGGKTEVVAIMVEAVGANGLIGGQMLDLTSTSTSAPAIAETYTMKTSALFEAACRIAAVVAGADDATASALRSFARSLGLAFQIADDMLDGALSMDCTGKDVGIDRDGATIASVAGVGYARRWQDIALRSANNNLKRLPQLTVTRSWMETLVSTFMEDHACAARRGELLAAEIG